jgi:PTS system fructose-specific IIC component
MRVTDILTTDCVKLLMSSLQKDDAIIEMAQLINHKLHVDSPDIGKLLINREQKRATYYGKNVGMPHTCMANSHAIAIGRCPYGIQWSDKPEENVTIVIMFVSHHSDFNEHIDTLRRLSRIISNDNTRQRIIKANSAEEIIMAITDGEAL